MTKGWTCEICGKDVWTSFRCEQCHRGVCSRCIVFPGNGKQVCSDCAFPKK